MCKFILVQTLDLSFMANEQSLMPMMEWPPKRMPFLTHEHIVAYYVVAYYRPPPPKLSIGSVASLWWLNSMDGGCGEKKINKQ